ncbi:MAG: phosphatidylinositol kinase [Brevibacillus sp.]|nr:phosphatidylinositol kinase [Brevibacillus sp.]
MHPQQAYHLCQEHLYRYVRIMTADGRSYDGFIAELDDQCVTLAIPICDCDPESSGESSYEADYRQVQFFHRRFRRRRIPLGIIASLFLLPFFFR